MKKQSIGEFLATLRKANGYTQQEVADKLGISNRTLSGWECNNVLPDILLLPALAEIYGVTVDEILAGERCERNEVAVSSNSEKKILKNKIARFSMQSWILLGVIITGMMLTAISAFIEVVTVSWVGFPWWRVLLFVGIVPVIVCLAILLAFWKGAELFVDDSVEGYSCYVLIIRKKLANSFFVSASASFLSAILVAVALFLRKAIHLGGIIASVAFGVLAILLFLAGWLLYKDALTKFGGENARRAIARNRNFFWAVGFWGMFPLVLSVILAIVLGCVQFEEKTVVYENASVDEFVRYMESLETTDKELFFPLSELAQKAELGDEFDLGDGYTAVYNGTSFTISSEQIVWWLHEENGEWVSEKVTVSTEFPRIILIDENGTFSFFNVRYRWFANNLASNSVDSPYVKYDLCTVERIGDGMAYIHKTVRDYSSIGYAVAFPIITADLLICLSLCVWKRNKYTVNL